jgi:hypothetical protein
MAEFWHPTGPASIGGPGRRLTPADAANADPHDATPGNPFYISIKVIVKVT